MPVDEGFLQLLERVAVLEEAHRQLARGLEELGAAVNGPPWERSVRGRIHVMEAEGSAAKAASAALSAAQAEHRKARAERAQAAQYRLTWRWKLLGAITAVFVAAAPYVTLFYGR